jgi:phage terminase large subunit-like protein
VLIFADGDGGFDVVPYVWLPGHVQAREDADHVPYRAWVRAGHLLTFEGRASTDPRAVALKIAELHGQYRIEALGFDRWRIADLRRELSDIGCDVPLVPFGQGYQSMAPAIDLLERLVTEGKLRHGNHPLLAMAVSNAKVEQDAAGNRKLSKRRSTGRIDPLVALTIAVGISTARKEPEPKYQMFVLA